MSSCTEAPRAPRAALLAALAFIAVAARAQDSPPRPTALWSEFVPYREVERDLPALRDDNVALYVAVRADAPDFDGFAHLYVTARSLGVEIRPWLLLRQDQGYWFNKWNVPESAQFVSAFLSEMRTRGVTPQWLVFDIETPAPRVDEMERDFSRGRLPALLALLSRDSRDGSIRAAIASYAELLADLHSRGIRVEAVTGNYVLNDDDHLRIQSALGLPISGLPWDAISFMVYRVEFQRAFGAVGEALVHKYAKRARRRFGDKAGIDVGEAGSVAYPQPFTGYTDPADLQRDVTAAASAGVAEVHVYSLDGMREKGLDYWLDSAPAPRGRYRDLKSDVFVAAVDVLRRLLPEGR
jgi:hypothetical protein